MIYLCCQRFYRFEAPKLVFWGMRYKVVEVGWADGHDGRVRLVALDGNKWGIYTFPCPPKKNF